MKCDVQQWAESVFDYVCQACFYSTMTHLSPQPPEEEHLHAKLMKCSGSNSLNEAIYDKIEIKVYLHL